MYTLTYSFHASVHPLCFTQIYPLCCLLNHHFIPGKWMMFPHIWGTRNHDERVRFCPAAIQLVRPHCAYPDAWSPLILPSRVAEHSHARTLPNHSIANCRSFPSPPITNFVVIHVEKAPCVDENVRVKVTQRTTRQSVLITFAEEWPIICHCQVSWHDNTRTFRTLFK